ncbi:MAG: UbiD family decarboxylase domain-containing protein [Candidatus Thorarchaeota archaeon]|jgi:2,5-furandicarboxylate decarboxylase 1
MILEKHIQNLAEGGKLTTVHKMISKNLEIAGVLKSLEPEPVLFENVKEVDFRVAGNLFCTKGQIADYFGIKTQEIIPTLAAAIENRRSPEKVEGAACQEVVAKGVDLNKYPILLHNEIDGGPYISSGVVVTADPEFGQNLDFHRAMQISKDKMVTRVVRGRDFHKFLERNGEIDVAYCIGNTAEVLVAAATSVETGINELEIANALKPINVTRAKTVDLMIPADCEFVFEGRVVLEEKHDEGPFIDLFRSVKQKGVEVLDVNITPGGSSWLHIAVQIRKEHDDDGLKTIEGAFEGHKSAKHVWVYDEDIDIYNEEEREWAMATRFQGDVDLLIKDPEPGSSLDPSAEPSTKLTTKIGFDCTKAMDTKGKSFDKADFPEVDLKKFLGE